MKRVTTTLRARIISPTNSQNCLNQNETGQVTTSFKCTSQQPSLYAEISIHSQAADKGLHMLNADTKPQHLILQFSNVQRPRNKKPMQSYAALQVLYTCTLNTSEYEKCISVLITLKTDRKRKGWCFCPSLLVLSAFAILITFLSSLFPGVYCYWTVFYPFKAWSDSI